MQFKNQRSGNKTVCGFSIIIIFFERNYDVLKSKTPCILLNKNINFNKNETESKMENHTHSFREMNLVFQLQRILKVKLWWLGTPKRIKKVFFVPSILSEGIFLNIFVLSQCIVYWIYFQNLHTFTYQKILLHTLFCLFLNSSKVFSVSLTFASQCNLLPFLRKILTFKTQVFNSTCFKSFTRSQI